MPSFYFAFLFKSLVILILCVRLINVRRGKTMNKTMLSQMLSIMAISVNSFFVLV